MNQQLKKNVLQDSASYERSIFIFSKYFKGSMFDASYYLSMLFDGQKEDILDDLTTMRAALKTEPELDG